MNHPEHQISAIILAGGEGKRLRGLDKGLALLESKPLAGIIAERLAPDVTEVIVSCNRNVPDYAGLGFRTVTDPVGEHRGPLVGIREAGKLCENQYICVVPCDVPFFPRSTVKALAKAVQSGECNAAYIHDGERPQFLFCLFRKELLVTIDDVLDETNGSVHGWLAAIDAKEVRLPGEEPAHFLNINTPEDLDKALLHKKSLER